MARSMGTKLGMTAALALAAACSTNEAGEQAKGSSASAGGGYGGATSSSSTQAVAVGAGGFGGSGSAASVCDPPAAPGSIWAATADRFGDAASLSMCRYRGDVMLIVNTAAL